MIVQVPDQQLKAGVLGTLVWDNTDQYGEGAPVDPNDSNAVPSVTVVNAAGDTIVDDDDATASTDLEGRYTLDVEGADLGSSPDLLTVTWTRPDATEAQTIVEVIGRHLFTVREARQSYTALANAQDYPSPDIARYLMIADYELMWICDRSFVPRMRQVTVDGSGEQSLLIPSDEHGGSNELRSVVFASIDGDEIDTSDLVIRRGRVERAAGDVWDWGQDNVVLRIEYGLDAPFPDLKEAAMVRMRELLMAKKRAVGPNATSSTQDGRTEVFDVDQFKTGNKVVDAVYLRYSNRFTAGDDGEPTNAPYGRSVQYYPQAGSLFHGGRRG